MSIPSDLLNSHTKPDELKITIVITPMRNGLFGIEVLQSRRGFVSYCNFCSYNFTIVNEMLAPLFNGAMVNRKWLAFFLKTSCTIYSKYSNMDPFEFTNKQLDHMLVRVAERKEYFVVFSLTNSIG